MADDEQQSKAAGAASSPETQYGALQPESEAATASAHVEGPAEERNVPGASEGHETEVAASTADGMSECGGCGNDGARDNGAPGADEVCEVAHGAVALEEPAAPLPDAAAGEQKQPVEASQEVPPPVAEAGEADLAMHEASPGGL
jgi:hypothetical protein